MRRFELADYLVTGAIVALYYGIEFGLDGPSRIHWSSAVPLIDEAARDLLVLPSRAGRETADQIADYAWYATTSYPVLLGLIGPLILGRPVDQAWQLSMMNLQAFTVASVLVRLPHKLLGRLRPDARGCAQDQEYSKLCGSQHQYVSFYGGHTSISVTGAGLACAHHQYAAPLGGGLPDHLGCAFALGLAGTVFVTRLQADRHWLSDQLVGALVGFGVGYGLPTLLYYRPLWSPRSARGEQVGSASFVLPMIADGDVGMMWIGRF